MQQLTLIIHKHSRDQSRDLVHFKSGFKKTGSTPGYFQLEKLLYGWLLTIERETKAVGLLTISLNVLLEWKYEAMEVFSFTVHLG